jgi:hypothetical protein
MLFENVLRGRERKQARTVFAALRRREPSFEPARDFIDDPPIRACLPGRLDGGADA